MTAETPTRQILSAKAIFVFVLVFELLQSARPAIATQYTAIDLYQLTVPAGFDALNGVTSLQNTVSQTVGRRQQVGAPTSGHAFLWSTSASAVDLNPTNLSGFTFSEADATDGTRQVGYAYRTGFSSSHAMLWSGTPDSTVDLHPTNIAGFSSSFVRSISGNQQAGYGTLASTLNHALVWSGTASSAIDLHPTNLVGFNQSKIFGTNGTQQVGEGFGTSIAQNGHALLWNNSADSAVDLNPTNLTGFTMSEAYATSGTQQVGQGLGSTTNNRLHAMLWNGTADSAVDLSPTNLGQVTTSSADGTNGIQQVGFANFSNGAHAIVWSGTADSAVDLQLFLPSGFASSHGGTIDSQGNIFGIATAFSGVVHAIEWVPQTVPEPSGIILIAIGLAPFVLCRTKWIIILSQSFRIAVKRGFF